MRRLAIFTAAFLALVTAPLLAHDVPDRVDITVLLKPERGRMLIAARVPANALIDFLLPTSFGNWVDLTNADVATTDAARVWIADLLSFRENGVPLPSPQLVKVRLSRVDDPSFATFDRARARVDGPALSPDTLVLQEQLTVDALLELPIASPDSLFTFTPRFGRLGVLVYTTLTYLAPDGRRQRFSYEGDPPEFALHPSLGGSLRRFAVAGTAHFFRVPEYLLFAMCIALVFPRTVKPLVTFGVTVIAMQVVGLLLARVGPPSSSWLEVLSEVLVAAAAVSAGIEAIVASPRPSMGLAAGAGAVFGVACWTALAPIVQFGGAHQLAASMAFVAGLTLAELAALTTSALAVRLLRFSRVPRGITIVIAAIAIHVSWQRMLARVEVLTLAGMSIEPGQAATWLALAAAIIVLLAWWQKRAGTRPPRAALRGPVRPLG